MITIKKLAIYHRYQGDGVMWNRMATPDEQTILKYSDWKLIEELIQDIIFLQNVKVGEEYKIKLTLTINENCDDEAKILLNKIVMKLRA